MIVENLKTPKGFAYCEICEKYIPIHSAIVISKTTMDGYHKVTATLCKTHANMENLNDWKSQPDAVLLVKDQVERRARKLEGLEGPLFLNVD